jgi:hypothetical protein
VFLLFALFAATGLCLVATCEQGAPVEDEEKCPLVEIIHFNCRLDCQKNVVRFVIDGERSIRALKLCDGKAYAVCWTNTVLAIHELNVVENNLQSCECVRFASQQMRTTLRDAGKIELIKKRKN